MTSCLLRSIPAIRKIWCIGEVPANNVVNVSIAVIVNAMQAETDKDAQERADQGHDERIEMLNELRSLRKMVEQLRDQRS